jgi:hypothetical protein
VALLGAPRLVRAAVRRRRYAGDGPRGGAEGAWAEVRATALDLGRLWADGITLRRQARMLVPAMGAEPLESLESLVLLVERSRYSRSGLSPDETDEARELSNSVTAAMTAAADGRTRRRATWFPRSLVGGTRTRRRPGAARRPVSGDPTRGREAELEEVSL